MNSPLQILLGNLDDVFWGGAEGGLVAEDTLAGSTTVFQAGSRSEPWAHCAIRTGE